MMNSEILECLTKVRVTDTKMYELRIGIVYDIRLITYKMNCNMKLKYKDNF